jgi:hypothetical protein
MAALGTICLRRLGGGRAGEMRFGRLLANPKVTPERLVEGWAGPTAAATAGRAHVLAVQDTSELCFRTTPERRRSLGEVGKGGRVRGLLLHAMLALDAGTGACLGLVGGEIWTRRSRVVVAHRRRPLAAKESRRWLATAERAKDVLAGAGMVTVVADRESDIYAEWAWLPAPGFHLLTRAMQDRPLAGGGTLFAAARAFPPAGTRTVELPASRPKRPAARPATLTLRFGRVALTRPKHPAERGLPASVALTLVEVEEADPPAGAEPVHWRLLTTHAVADAEAGWRVVGWYKARWTIEQLFRTLKRQGLDVEASQLGDASRLLKLTAVAARAAAVTLQLVQARDGAGGEPAAVALDEDEAAALDALGSRLEGGTARQRNPHPPRSLAWAAWIVARLGGWDGYPSARRPPGPITLKRGLDRLRAIAEGWTLRDLCMP